MNFMGKRSSKQDDLFIFQQAWWGKMDENQRINILMEERVKAYSDILPGLCKVFFNKRMLLVFRHFIRLPDIDLDFFEQMLFP